MYKRERIYIYIRIAGRLSRYILVVDGGAMKVHYMCSESEHSSAVRLFGSFILCILYIKASALDGLIALITWLLSSRELSLGRIDSRERPIILLFIYLLYCRSALEAV